jgi:hypothetical protein
MVSSMTACALAFFIAAGLCQQRDMTVAEMEQHRNYTIKVVGYDPLLPKPAQGS